MLTLTVSFLCGGVLLTDCWLRYRSATRSGVQGASDWRGFVPYPVVALCGAVSSIAVGWVGIALAVAAGLVASETFKVTSPPDVGGERFDAIRRHGEVLQIGVLFVLELLVSTLCVRELFELCVPIFSAYWGLSI